MGKEKTKKKRAGPLFTKTTGATPPVKKQKDVPVRVKTDTNTILIMKKLPPPVFKDGRWTDDEDQEAEIIEINGSTLSPTIKEVAVKKVRKNSVPVSKKEAKEKTISVKKDTKGNLVLTKVPPPVLKNGRWTDDEDEEEKAEEIPLQPTNKKSVVKDEDSSFSEESNDSFDDYFPSAKSEDEEKKERNVKKKTRTKFDNTIDSSISGYKKANHGGSNTFGIDDECENVYCSVCTQHLTVANFYNHILDMHGIQLEKDQYKCKECNHISKNLRAFKWHFNIHREMLKPKQCEICGEAYITYREYRRHTHRIRGKDGSSSKSGIKIKRSDSPKEKREFTCEFCSKTVLSLKSLEFHIANIHQKIGRECRYCSKLIPYDIWEEHKQMEKEKRGINKPVVCDICGVTLASKISAAQHRRNFHRPDHPDWHCDICGKTFKQSTALSMHKKNNHGEKKFQCAYCEYREVYRHLITVHIRRKHKIPKEEIPDDAVIEHAEGPRKDLEVKDESSPYFQKKKAKLLEQMLLKQQKQEEDPFEIKDDESGNLL